MRGPCAKREVVCVITSTDGWEYWGKNDCANPQVACPRALGEGYEKCKSICQQAGHAEIEALKVAGPDAKGAVARLTGHYWICEPCGAALRDAGVQRLEIIYGDARPWNVDEKTAKQMGSGSLNPTWVEWLMGFPLGWTVLEHWVTRSSRKSSK